MDVDAALALLSSDPSAPLELAEVGLQLARDEYPDLDVEAYLCELAGMAHEARGHLRGSLESRVQGLSRYLFHEMGFRGDRLNYHDARNSYLNEVLDRRAGLPISLSAVAMAVGRRAGLEVVGIGLPGHFVAKAVDGPREVLFDPFNGGRVLTPEACQRLVFESSGKRIKVDGEVLQAVPLAAIVQRMLNNLKGTYLRGGDFRRAARVIRRMRQIDPDDPSQRRDLGALLLQSGEPGRAIDHLAAYLADVPSAPDAGRVRMLLDKARTAVARWN